MPTSELIEREQALSDMLQSMQDTLTQQGKFCPAIHHTFDEFELVHFSLDQSIVLGKVSPATTAALSRTTLRTNPCNWAVLAGPDRWKPVVELFSCARS